MNQITLNPFDSCMKTECQTCHKTTWKGCGKHVETVMADVPEEQQCKCPRNA